MIVEVKTYMIYRAFCIMDKGWISVHRKIQSHWIWETKQPYSNLQAWMDLLLTVNHMEKKVLIKNILFEVKRGQSIKSLDTWAKRWNWNKSKVRRFLKVLQSDNMIEFKSETQTTRITICNYDSYQDNGNASETQVTPNNNVNNINNENNNTSPEVDFDKLLLRFNNITNKKTRVVNKKVKRQIVARLKEGYTKQDIITAIESCYNDDYHKETEHKYLTLEFITRADKLDKYSQIKNQHVATTGRFKGYKVGDRFENRTVTRISDKGEAVFVNDKDIL